MKNTIWFEKFNSDWNIVHWAVKSWLEGLYEAYSKAPVYIQAVCGEPGSIGIHVDVEKCAENHHDFDWLETVFYQLAEALKQINGMFYCEGKITWEHGDHDHVLEANVIDIVSHVVQHEREMTVGQIEQELGYKVKIVGGSRND